MGHGKGGRTDRAARSRSAVSSLAVPLKPACPAQQAAPLPFSAPQNSLLHPGVVDYRESVRLPHRLVRAGNKRTWEKSELGKQSNTFGAQLPAPNVMWVMCAIIICAM